MSCPLGAGGDPGWACGETGPTRACIYNKMTRHAELNLRLVEFAESAIAAPFRPWSKCGVLCPQLRTEHHNFGEKNGQDLAAKSRTFAAPPNFLIPMK